MRGPADGTGFLGPQVCPKLRGTDAGGALGLRQHLLFCNQTGLQRPFLLREQLFFLQHLLTPLLCGLMLLRGLGLGVAVVLQVGQEMRRLAPCLQGVAALTLGLDGRRY